MAAWHDSLAIGRYRNAGGVASWLDSLSATVHMHLIGGTWPILATTHQCLHILQTVNNIFPACLSACGDIEWMGLSDLSVDGLAIMFVVY